MILLGIILGLAFLLFDRWRSTAPGAPASAPTLTALPTAVSLLVPSLQPSLIPTREPQARLFIPAVNVNVAVVDTYLNADSWDVAQLGDNAGHLQGTAWFGAPGNIALAGHVELADGRAGIFAGINRLVQGDVIILMLGEKQQRYSVTEVSQVAPDDLSVLYPTSNDQVTLITCNSYDFLQNDYQERVVVVAERTA